MDKVNHQLNKAQLRRTLLKTRQSMSVGEWREKSGAIRWLVNHGNQPVNN